MLGSLPINGGPTSPQQGDVLYLASHVPAAVSMPSLDVSPTSPRLFGSAALPQTPPSQLLRTVSSPPPVKRLRNIASPPPASHPILSSAITVACTKAPEAGRLPTRRQLAFPILSSPPVQRASPFAAAASVPEPATLLDKINSLPGPHQLLRSVLTENKASLSLQDSGMLTHMLHRATLIPTGDESSAGASSSAGSACSLSVEDAASPMKAKSHRRSAPTAKAPAPAVRAPAPSPAVKTLAPPVSRFSVEPATVSSLLSSSRSAFSKTALKHNAYASRAHRTAYGAPAPSSDPQSSPQGICKGTSMRTQGRATLQQAATVPCLPPADSLFSYSSAGSDCTQPGPVTCPSATALTPTVPKGRLCSATARLDSSAKPFCPFPDRSDLSNKVGKVDAINQAVRATEYSPRGCVSGDPAGFTDGTDHVASPTASRSGLFPAALPNGAVPGATRSSPSNYQTGRDLLTIFTDIGSAHTRTTTSEKLRPLSTGLFSLTDAIDRGRASLSETLDPRASHKGLPGWCPPQGTAGAFSSSHSNVECRLTLPWGTRGHKRPRLEDKLKEVIDSTIISDTSKSLKCTSAHGRHMAAFSEDVSESANKD